MMCISWTRGSKREGEGGRERGKGKEKRNAHMLDVATYNVITECGS